MSRAYYSIPVTAGPCGGCDQEILTRAAHLTLTTWGDTPEYRATCRTCGCVNTRPAGAHVLATLNLHEWSCWRETWPEEHDPARALGVWIPGEGDRLARLIDELEEVPGPAHPGATWALPGAFPLSRTCEALAEAWPGDV